MSDNFRIGLACVLGLCWCVWVMVLWIKNRPKTANASATKIVAFASQTGQARLHAEDFVASLTDAILLPLNQLTADKLQTASEVHLFVSTYGDGEAPDNGRTFIRSLTKISNNALKQVNYTVTAFGDSHYPAFCAFGKQVFTELAERGAQAIEPLICIDASQPQTKAQHSIANYSDVAVTQIRQLNTGSPFAGLYLIELSAANLSWQAGDILEVLPPADNKQMASPRSYSIASADSRFVEKNQLQLIVRLLTKDDGTTGLASGYLTQSCQVGSQIKVKVRANPACQLKSAQAPLLLIGAGSGLAGLIGHIEQRCHFADAGPVWLIYGERDAEFDCHMQTELEAWQQQGVLTRVDRVFSRSTHTTDTEKAKYVYQVLSQQAEDVRRFIKQGADVYVCGSLEGMGKSVDKALLEILGEQSKQQLSEQERYHRDLY